MEGGGVQFEEDTMTAGRAVLPRSTGPLVKWVLGAKLAQNERGANYILIAVALLAVALSITILVLTWPHTPTPTAQDLTLPFLGPSRR